MHLHYINTVNRNFFLRQSHSCLQTHHSPALSHINMCKFAKNIFHSIVPEDLCSFQYILQTSFMKYTKQSTHSTKTSHVKSVFRQIYSIFKQIFLNTADFQEIILQIPNLCLHFTIRTILHPHRGFYTLQIGSPTHPT